MKKNKIKSKRRKKNRLPKLIFLIFLFSFSFCFTLNYFTKNIDNSSFIDIITNDNIKPEAKYVTNFLKLITNTNLKKPETLVLNNYHYKNNTSSDDNKDINTLPESNYIKDPYDNKEVDKPIVYLYNTHQSEEYAISNSEKYNVKPTVMMTSYILREKLNKNKIPTIVEENDVTEFLKTNNWNYSSSYKVTRLLLEDIYNKYNSLKYFIDLHRDSVKKSISTVKINNKNYAKILFIVGLDNENYKENLKFTEELNKMFNEKYPNLSRGIYKKQGSGVNGIYNQDFNPNTILIEVGGQDNTIDEINNTCEAISEILTEYIIGEENEK